MSKPKENKFIESLKIGDIIDVQNSMSCYPGDTIIIDIVGSGVDKVIFTKQQSFDSEGNALTYPLSNKIISLITKL